MNRQEATEAIEKFLELMQREQLLKEELLALKMRGSRATTEEINSQLQYHDSLIVEVERIRNQEMLPILEKCMAFLASTRVDGVS